MTSVHPAYNCISVSQNGSKDNGLWIGRFGPVYGSQFFKIELPSDVGERLTTPYRRVSLLLANFHTYYNSGLTDGLIVTAGVGELNAKRITGEGLLFSWRVRGGVGRLNLTGLLTPDTNILQVTAMRNDAGNYAGFHDNSSGMGPQIRIED